MNSTAPILELKHVKKSFTQGGDTLHVLQDICLQLEQGEMKAITGPSGCGKSTLLQIAGLLDNVDEGEIYIEGHNCTKKRERVRTVLRREKLGFVYQYHHLLAEFTAVENILLPQLIRGVSYSKAKIEALRLLEQFGLVNRAYHKPGQLSGGEQQRIAIARALINQPALLLADEPTGNLDPHTADSVFAIMMQQVRARNLAVLMVTHNAALAKRADSVMVLEDGKIVS